MNKAQFLVHAKDMSYHANSATNDNVKVDLLSKCRGGQWKVSHTKAIYKGKPFNHYGRFTDMWIYQNSEWQCVASHTTLLQK